VTCQVGILVRDWEVVSAQVENDTAGLKFVREGEIQFARLDLATKQFVDPTPIKIDTKTIDALVRRIRYEID